MLVGRPKKKEEQVPAKVRNQPPFGKIFVHLDLFEEIRFGGDESLFSLER